MLQLLVPVALDPLEQSRESLLLPLPKKRFLFLNVELKCLLGLLCFLLLHLLALKLEEFSLLVPLRESELLDFVFQLHQLA